MSAAGSRPDTVKGESVPVRLTLDSVARQGRSENADPCVGRSIETVPASAVQAGDARRVVPDRVAVDAVADGAVPVDAPARDAHAVEPRRARTESAVAAVAESEDPRPVAVVESRHARGRPRRRVPVHSVEAGAVFPDSRLGAQSVDAARRRALAVDAVAVDARSPNPEEIVGVAPHTRGAGLAADAGRLSVDPGCRYC